MKVRHPNDSSIICSGVTNYAMCVRVSNQIKSKSNQKVLFKVGTLYNNQHKLSRAFQTDMHNKLHKLNTAQ
jgi:hypothetical protein